MSGRILLLILWMLGGVVQASASASPTGTPHDLLQRSLKTSSATERSIIRGYLAKTYPASPEGLFAAAWLAGMDGRTDDKIRLYEAAIEADPELTVAYINLALEFSGSGRLEDARNLYDKALTTAPFDIDLVRNGFFLRKEKLGDKEGAARFLDEWQGKVGNLDYEFDFVRGLDADADGRLAEAEQHYRSAISKDAPFEVYERLAGLRLKQVPESANFNSDKFAAIVDVMETLVDDEKTASADANLYVGRALRDLSRAKGLAIKYMSKGFDMEPDAEKAGEIFTELANVDFVRARAFLEKAQTILPDNYGVLNSLAWMHYQFLAEPDRAGEFAKQALDLAPHDDARLDIIRSFGASRQQYGRFNEAHQFYLERLAHPWTADFRNRLLMMVTDNLIAAQRFDEARTYLDTLRASHKGSSAWLDRKSRLVENAIALETQRASAISTPAMNWRNGFDPESPPRVLFALNSAVVPAYAHDLLDKSAQLLKADLSNELVLSVEGYTDLTGSEVGNDALSLRRAEAVRDYLVEKHGVPPAKLRLSAHASRFPTASNQDRQGRTLNRRVEIRAVDATSLTENPVPSAEKGSAFSPDGRYAVFGQSPPQVWDMRANVKLHDLYRGRDHRFSPNGRFISAISSFKEEGGTSVEAIYIYDAASGTAVAQIHEPLEIVGLDWNPDSTAIAFVTADGFLKVYDLETRVFNGVTRMGPVRIGGPVVWFPDGKTIAGGQHRMKEVVMWDAASLAQKRRLPGVNWPHAVGASPDGRHLLAFDNRMTMSVWDLRKGAALRQTRVPMIPRELQFHPLRPLILFNARFEASEVSLAAMNYVRMSQVAQWSGAGTYPIGLLPEGASLLVADKDRVIEFDSTTLEIVHTGRASSEER